MMAIKSITLTETQWANLDRLAINTESLSTGGPRATVGQPSWRAMIRRIAEGELFVVDLELLPDYLRDMIAERLAERGGVK